MSYNPRGGHGYGNQKHGSSRFSWRGRKKPKENDVQVKDDPEPKVAPETIAWAPRPLEIGTKVILSKPTTLTSNSSKVLLSNDLEAQKDLGYQISLLAETLKLEIECLGPNGECRKFKVIKIVDQTPNDKAVTFADMALVGNLKNALKPCGYTLIGR